MAERLTLRYLGRVPPPPPSRTILIVEDDARTSASVALYLRHAGYDAVQVADGPAALTAAADLRPDLVVLDVMLPGIDGFEVCRTLRRAMNVPVIMLTARAVEEDKLRGLESGADDYVTKPFSPRELVARIGAVLRRTRPPLDAVTCGEVVIDVNARQVRRAGSPVAVTATEFRLLEVLASAPGRAFTRSELAERALGHAHDALERTIDVHVMNLRRKLEPARGRRASVIATVFGIGYRLGGAGDGY
jgi:two-component system, OmpR family, alkaline phosphatase synthesis response regulator PhoP